MVQTHRIAPPYLLVVGATASGKSGVGMALAKHFDTEIISCDSMQIYQEMNVGTAKITDAEQCGIRHHMIDILPPSQQYSVSEYVADAEKIAADLQGRGKVPIFVGGTGLYVNGLLFSYSFGNAEKSEQIREKWEQYFREHGAEALHDRLRDVDFQAAEEIHPNNVKRVIRALEVHDLGGKRESGSANAEAKRPYVLAGLQLDRTVLYERINRRVDEMMSNGLVEEVDSLLRSGEVQRNNQSMQAIGYREIAAYLNGECDLSSAVNAIKQNTRHYAKRQLTWFKRIPKLQWFDVAENSAKTARDIAEYYENSLKI